MKIPFNRQNLFGDELKNIEEAYSLGKVSGDGVFTRWCNSFLETRFRAKKALLTTSCTHALEMAMLLIDLQKGDEVIVPSYTFVSTVNAIALRGAIPVFIDIREDTLNMNERLLEGLITKKTKAILPVHYAGVACEMDTIMKIAKKYNLWVIEDAAQGVNSRYKNKYLGTIGHIGCYSFHETKNYSMGEGGAILVNTDKFKESAEIIREKGTNRSKFFRGEIDKYTWVDVGSSYLPSEINAAVLKVQFQKLDEIQNKRNSIYQSYYEGLSELESKGKLKLPEIPEECVSNGHMFYILTQNLGERTRLISFLKEHEILSVFHYVPLHSSKFAIEKFGEISLPKTEDLSSRLLRLPMYYSLKMKEVEKVIDTILNFYKS